MTRYMPDGYHSLTPSFVFKDARKAIEFYKAAFGAVERYAMPGPDGKGIMHAELLIGDSIFMMGEECPSMPCKSAETMGGSPISLYLYVENADASFGRAVEAGAKPAMPVQDMFWGDRAGSVTDPFGYSWMIATHTKELSKEEIAEGARKAFDAMGNR